MSKNSTKQQIRPADHLDQQDARLLSSISDAIEKCSIFRFFLYASICRKRKGAYGFSAAELFDHPVGFDGVRTWIAWKELRQTGFRNAIFTALDRVVN